MSLTSMLSKVATIAEKSVTAVVKATRENMGGAASLEDAYIGKKAPNKPGVYKVFYRGELMKVGKAQDGLRKRFSDYYRGMAGGTAGLKHIHEGSRDEVRVWWVVCPRGKCRELEKKLYDDAVSKGQSMPWSSRR